MNQPAPLVRQPIAPPAHIAYAHKLGRGMLTFEQVDQLVLAINPLYVQQKQRNSYLAHHQARAEMNRIFGYLNWDSVAEEMKLGYEERVESTEDPRWPKERNGDPKKSASGHYWICGYEGVVRVTVRDLWGMPLAEYREYHFEENAIQPNRGEARSLAMTSVESYALRRALINMGDRFGLGLYNGGSQAAHGQYTQQLFPGQLFNLVDGSGQQQIAAPAITHQNIQAEQAIADDVLPAWTPDQDQQPQQVAPQQQPQQQAQPQQQFQHPPQEQQMPQQQTQQPQQQPVQQGGMQEFHQAQEQLQQGRQEYRQQYTQAPMGAGQQPPQFDPNILAQAQGGFKVDQ